MLINNKKNNKYVTACLTVAFICFSCVSFSNAKAEFPPTPKASIYLNEIDNNNYIANKQLHGAKNYKWNFSNKNQYVYSYLRKSIEDDVSNLFGVELGRNTTEIILNAKLFINSLGNHTADLILKDIETIIKYRNNEEKEKQNEKKLPGIPSTVITTIDQYGFKKAEKNNQDLLTGLLFPLPNKQLKLKEQITINKSIPIAINDKTFSADGELEITLTDYVLIDGKDCARFEVIADLKNLNTQNGNSRYTIKTNTVYYFDIENHCLITGASAVLHSIRYEDTTTKQKIINDNHFLVLIKLEHIKTR